MLFPKMCNADNILHRNYHFLERIRALVSDMGLNQPLLLTCYDSGLITLFNLSFHICNNIYIASNQVPGLKNYYHYYYWL